MTTSPVREDPDGQWQVSARAELRARVVETGRAALVRVEEPLDLATAACFVERVRPLVQRCRWLVLDLRHVEFMDSSGVRALMRVRQELADPQGEVRLVLPPESRVRRTLSLLRLCCHFRIFTSVSDAWFGCGGENC